LHELLPHRWKQTDAVAPHSWKLTILHNC
jgi:hypothetical protein